ncbi:MAG: TRAP transporter substrate-binding protein DctP [Deltaproteobacteria bacterium]|nr:TRAP transporter substrate-binding protein DctP [Deltaproteobacteria bacterium]
MIIQESKKLLVISAAFMIVLLTIILNFTALKVLAAEPIVLSMAPSSAFPPPAAGQTTVFANQMKLLEERTNGRLKVEIYWGQSLAKGRDLVTAVQTGIADIAKINPHYEPGKLPLSNIAHMPGIGTHMWPRSRAVWDLYQEEPLKSEYDQFNLHPIGLAVITDQGLMCNEPVKMVEDIKGNKFAGAGIVGETIKLLGGVPIHLTPGEEYDLLKKGMIKGICAPLGAVYDFKFYEGGKYFTRFQLGHRTGAVVMNGDVYRKLPDDIRKVIDDAWLDMINISYEDFNKTDEMAIKIMKETGVEFIDPSPEDVAIVRKAQAKLVKNWADDLEGKGLQANKLLARYTELVEKYEKVNPYKE